ncbi:hypothetical protein KJJ36_13980 [Staphylococcus pseudoxylosus]|uniref:hypothetical protein n=1 Tax=Staphylococcus pseudoxylosus TaxID=2282419 RepID=UPI001F34717F|nr:hypothetical protein [Staphylococcus pseudoxylosus]MCE5003476.1 hypothetical protein [Staphylococcus pseudoxylosus]
MADIKNLELSKLSLPNGEQVTIPVLITLKDSFLEDKTEKKVSRDWKLFTAKYSKDKPKENYFVATDFELTNEDIFKNKENVIAVNLESISAIEQKEIEKLDFGFRILFNDGTLRELGTKQNEHVGTDLNSSLEFNKLQELHEKLFNFLNNTVEEFQFKENAKNRAEVELKKSEKEETNIEENPELLEPEEDAENETEEKTENVEENSNNDKQEYEIENSNDEHSNDEEPNSQGSELDNIDEDYSEEDIQPIEFEEEPYSLESMKEVARKYIENYIPKPTLENIEAQKQSENDEKFGDLYKATLDGINSKINGSKDLLFTERERIITFLNRELDKEIVDRYYKNLKLLDYKDESNEFNWIYKKLDSGYRDVISDLEPAAEERKETLLRDHKKRKEEVKIEAAEKAGREFDAENLPLIDEQVENEKEQRRSEAITRYEEEMDKLDEDVDFILAEKNAKLVDDVISEYKNLIDESINAFTDKVEYISNEIQSKIEEKWDQFEERVRDIQKTEIESRYNQQSAVDAEVDKKLPQLNELNNKIDTKENEISALRKSLRELREDGITKEHTISAISTEREELLKRLDRLTEEKEVAEKNKTETLEKYNQYLKDNANVSGANYPNVSEKKENNDPWYIKFKDYIVFGGASIILATGLIVSSQNGSDASDIADQRQKLEEQQKDIKSATEEQSKKEEELKKTQQQFEEKQKQLDDREKELDKKDKDKKDK